MPIGKLLKSSGAIGPMISALKASNPNAQPGGAKENTVRALQSQSPAPMAAPPSNLPPTIARVASALPSSGGGGGGGSLQDIYNHLKGYGGGGGSPVKFQKREGTIGDC